MVPRPEPERREVKVYGPGWRTAERVEMVPAAHYDRVAEERDRLRQLDRDHSKNGARWRQEIVNLEREVERLRQQRRTEMPAWTAEIKRLRGNLREGCERIDRFLAYVSTSLGPDEHPLDDPFECAREALHVLREVRAYLTEPEDIPYSDRELDRERDRRREDDEQRDLEYEKRKWD